MKNHAETRPCVGQDFPVGSPSLSAASASLLACVSVPRPPSQGDALAGASYCVKVASDTPASSMLHLHRINIDRLCWRTAPGQGGRTHEPPDKAP